MENLDGMDDFLDRNHLPKLKKDELQYLNSSITPKEIDVVIKNLLTRKTTTTKCQSQMVLVQNLTTLLKKT